MELVHSLTVLGIVLLLAAPRIGTWLDRLAVSRAAAETAAFYSRSRFTALFRSMRVRAEFRADSLRAVGEAVRDSALFAVAGPARHGVTLVATRRTIRIGPTGLGWGAANTRLILSRGAVAETLTTSRLGRLKRW